jgi:hypothetical protein
LNVLISAETFPPRSDKSTYVGSMGIRELSEVEVSILRAF